MSTANCLCRRLRSARPFPSAARSGPPRRNPTRCITTRTRSATSPTRCAPRSWSPRGSPPPEQQAARMRYLPLTAEDRAEMLAKIGVGKIDDLFADVPAGKLLSQPPALPRHKSELEVERVLGRMAARNMPAGSVPFFVGCGAYKHRSEERRVGKESR